jgi:hypothetical protein
LLLVPGRDHPDLTGRLTDFLQDRGAIGLLLAQYETPNTIEEVALSFWRSRTEKSAARLEDIVTTVLLATFSAIIAGILVEMWKGEFGPIKKLFRESDRRYLQRASRREPQLRTDLDMLLPLYRAKLNGKGITDPNVATRLYAEIGRGISFQTFYEQNRYALPQGIGFDPLQHASEVCRGVVLTEFRRAEGFAKLPTPLEKTGLPLSPYLAFGEALPLFPAADLGLGPNWQKRLTEKLTSKRLYPNFWPSGVSRNVPSPKVLILDEEVFRMLGSPEYYIDLLAKCGGVVSMDSGMVSHLAVLSRGMGIGAISCPLSDDERASAKFVLFQDGRLTIYRDVPNLTASDFECLMAALSSGHPGD